MKPLTSQITFGARLLTSPGVEVLERHSPLRMDVASGDKQPSSCSEDQARRTTMKCKHPSERRHFNSSVFQPRR